MEREPAIGDFVFIHLRDGLDPRLFGGTMIVGTVVDVGLDVLLGEVVYEIETHPGRRRRVYRGHIRAISNHGSDVLPVG